MRAAPSKNIRLKNLARSLCPPALWELMSQARRRGGERPRDHKPNYMFSGVYPSFESVKNDEPWTKADYLETRRRMLQECQSAEIPPSATSVHALLAFIINTLPVDRAPRVLDWGGGTGLRYWTTRPALNRAVHWQVVDNEALAIISRDTMGPSEELHFVDALPSSGSSFDILLIFSSLQYIEQQAQLLVALAAYRPRFIVLARLMALRDDSFVTSQSIGGHCTPCKVSNLQEILTTLKGQQYNPALMIEDGFDLLPLFEADVPASLRVGKEFLVVFEKAT